MTPLALWPRFRKLVRGRLERGAREYPDSPARSLPSLADEIAAELADLAGWGCVLYTRVEALREKLSLLEARGEGAPDDGVVVKLDPAELSLLRTVAAQSRKTPAEVLRLGLVALVGLGELSSSLATAQRTEGSAD
jgi:hypothetical protein